MPNKKACDLRPTLFTKKNLKQKDARHAPFHDETMRNQKSSCLIISQQPVSVQTTLPQHLTDSRPLFHHKSCCIYQRRQHKAAPSVSVLVFLLSSHMPFLTSYLPHTAIFSAYLISLSKTRKESKYRGNTRSEIPSYIYVSNSAAENVISFCK